MYSIITGVLQLTVGVLFNKFRDTTAAKLKEGDLTDEKCRQLIVRELIDDIKSKLDALIRKDLLRCVEFFRDGMNNLEMAIQDSICVAQGVLNIVSDERFKKAQESFKAAGEEATRAFSNPALSTKDKILATKLRITCSILEGINDIQASIKAAIVYLDRLHYLPAVQEAFSVHLDGGLKSIFSKKKRLKIVQAISIINYELFYFARLVVKTSVDLFSWPKIKLASCEYQPVLRDHRIPLTEFGISANGPCTISFTSVEVIPSCSTINSKGDVIAQDAKATIFIFFAKPSSMSDQHKKFCSFSAEDRKKPGFAIDCMTIDVNDNLYVITNEQSQDLLNYMLYIFDSSGMLIQQCLLEISSYHREVYGRASIAVNKLGQIVMSGTEDKQIYIFDTYGQLHRRFPQDPDMNQAQLENGNTVYVTSSDTNEIITAEYRHYRAYVHTAEGKYSGAFQQPKGHTAGIAFNHITKSIILLTSSWSESSSKFLLSSYGPNTDEPQILQLNVNKRYNLTSHPNGLVALISKDGVIFV